MLREFRDFVMRGNVVELAVAVIIGAAFGAVITAFTAAFITPLIALIGGKPDFGDLRFTISGVMKAAVNAVMTAPNAAPMMTATASSTTLPRMTKSRNSLSTCPSLPLVGMLAGFYGRGRFPPLPRRGP